MERQAQRTAKAQMVRVELRPFNDRRLTRDLVTL